MLPSSSSGREMRRKFRYRENKTSAETLTVAAGNRRVPNRAAVLSILMLASVVLLLMTNSSTTLMDMVNITVSYRNGESRLQSVRKYVKETVMTSVEEEKPQESSNVRRNYADPALLDAIRVIDHSVWKPSDERSPCTNSVFMNYVPEGKFVYRNTNDDEDEDDRNNQRQRAQHLEFLYRLERKLCAATGGGEAIDKVGSVVETTGAVTVMVTFSNMAYSEMLDNFVRNLKQQKLNSIVIGALDDDTVTFSEQKLGVGSIDIGSEEGIVDAETVFETLREDQLLITDKKSSQLGSGNFRTDGEAFTLMGVKKGALVRAALSLGFNVIVSDTDVVWKRNPLVFFDGRDEAFKYNTYADMLVSSDCFSGAYDRQLREQGAERLRKIASDGLNDLTDDTNWWEGLGDLFHEQNGNCILTNFNTGVLFFRATHIARRLVDSWIRTMMSGGAYAFGISREEQGKSIMDDQQSLNFLVRNGPPRLSDDVEYSAALHKPLLLVPEGEGHLFWAYNRQLRMGYLPLHLFANGYTHWVQQLSSNYTNEDMSVGVIPFSTHATTTFYGYDGKRSRFRSDLTWLEDDDAYYNGKFVVLKMHKNEYPMQVFNESASEIERHMWAMTHTVLSIRNGFAIARALDRKLIIPSFLCFCDRYFNNVLPYCRTPGSALELPFECPTDHVFNVGAFERKKGTFPYRENSFLRNPRVPEAILKSPRIILSHGNAPAIGTNSANECTESDCSAPINVKLPMFPTEDELRTSVLGYESSPIVEISSPATSFCRFDSDVQNSVFDSEITEMLIGHWCCWNKGQLSPDVPKGLNRIRIDECTAARSSHSTETAGVVHAKNIFQDALIPQSVLAAREAMEWTLNNPDYIKRTFTG